jgi:hypothetical protein
MVLAPDRENFADGRIERRFSCRLERMLNGTVAAVLG